MDADTILIHARFAPNGTVVEISERPQGLDPQAWFDFLSYRTGTTYQALAGGRGIFRISRAAVDAFKAEATAKAA